MKVYVAGSLADVVAVQAVQSAVKTAGHSVTHDWTRDLDVALNDYAEDPDAAARIASTDLLAVLEADALVLVANEQPGRGMFVELGAALACVARGQSMEVVVVGSQADDSVFYFHPAVQRYVSVTDWLRATEGPVVLRKQQPDSRQDREVASGLAARQKG
jgi:hypothetical protein